MFLDALKQVTGLFDRRFFMYVFVPGCFFWTALIAVWFAGQGRLSVTIVSWNQQQALPKTIEIVSFLMCIYLFASVLGGLSSPIVRFYEGYWNFPGAQAFKDFGVRRHKAILGDLAGKANPPNNDPQVSGDPEAAERIYYYYPAPTFDNRDVMPTLLGNILKNSELYAGERYEVNSVLIWPRLHKLFPPEFAEEVALMRGNLDFMLLITSLSIAFALLSGVYLVFAGADWRLFVLCFWGGLVLGWVTYQSALSSARSYASQIKVAFDLYRERLLEQMRVPLPPDQESEKKTWTDLARFLYQSTPLPFSYAAAPKPTQPSQNPDAAAPEPAQPSQNPDAAAPAPTRPTQNPPPGIK